MYWNETQGLRIQQAPSARAATSQQRFPRSANGALVLIALWQGGKKTSTITQTSLHPDFYRAFSHRESRISLSVWHVRPRNVAPLTTSRQRQLATVTVGEGWIPSTMARQSLFCKHTATLQPANYTGGAEQEAHELKTS